MYVLPWGQMSFWGFQNSPKWEYSFLILTSKLLITHQSFRYRVLSKNRIGPHNYNILCLIFGSLLGDSYPETRNNSTRIHFKQEDSNVKYLHHIWKLINDAGYCSDEKPELKPRIGKKIKFGLAVGLKLSHILVSTGFEMNFTLIIIKSYLLLFQIIFLL